MKIISTIVFLLCSFGALAQEGEWTLERCIRHALEKSLSLEQQRCLIEKSRNRVNNSRLSHLPNLNADISQDFFSHDTQFDIEATMELEILQKVYTTRSLQTSVEIESATLEELKNELSISICRAYLQVLLSREMVHLCSIHVESIAQQKHQTGVWVKNGKLSHTAYLDIESEWAQEKARLTDAQCQFRLDLLILKQLLDIPEDTPFSIPEQDTESSLTKSHSSYTDQDMEKAISLSERLPQIRKAILEVEKGNYELKTAQSRLSPTLALTAGYPVRIHSSNGYKTYPGIRLSLNIPILNGYGVRTSIRNARLDLRCLELQLKESRKRLTGEIQKVYLQASVDYERMKATKTQLKALETSFACMEKKFSVGKASSLDYILSKSKLMSAQAEHIQACYQFIFQLKIIDFYNGIPIRL